MAQNIPHLLHVDALLAVVLLLLTLILADTGLDVGACLGIQLVVFPDGRIERIPGPEILLCRLFAAAIKSGIILVQ